MSADYDKHPDRLSPAVLWQQAHDEHPSDQAARRIRYVELMREHGHLVPTLPGQSRNLPCGWPGDRRTSEDER